MIFSQPHSSSGDHVHDLAQGPFSCLESGYDTTAFIFGRHHLTRRFTIDGVKAGRLHPQHTRIGAHRVRACFRMQAA
jgi:hypothetical protein